MKVSTLGFAILGLLAGERMSGYDLKLRMGKPVVYFWQARHSQIYPELAKLEGAGLVSYEVVPQGGKPDKKVYGITDEGLAVVSEWVSKPAEVGPTRDEATLKAYLSWLGDPEETAGSFREVAARHEERLREYEETEKWMRREWGESFETEDIRKFAGYAALKRGIGYEREYAEWCRWMARHLEERNG